MGYKTGLKMQPNYSIHQVLLKNKTQYTVRPNKRETRKSSYFPTEIESFIKYNFHCYKVHFIFFHLTPKISCPRMTEQEQFEMSMSKSVCA